MAKAGVTSVRKYETVASDGSFTENVEIVFGKEYDSFRTRMIVDLETEQVLELEVDAQGVRAFEGQAAAGEIVEAIRKSLSERDIAISEAAFPIIRDIIAAAITGGMSIPGAIVLPQEPASVRRQRTPPAEFMRKTRP